MNLNGYLLNDMNLVMVSSYQPNNKDLIISNNNNSNYQ